MKKAKLSIWWLQPLVSYLLPSALFLLPFLALPAQAAIDVWAVGECIRINPQTGVAYEDNRVYAGDLKGDYRNQNLVWDRKQNLVRLFGGRNEVVAFQLILRSEDLRQIRVSVSDLRESKTKTVIPSKFSGSGMFRSPGKQPMRPRPVQATLWGWDGIQMP